MSIYDILFDMNAVPKQNPDAAQSRTAAQFIRYASRSIEWAAAKYVREYNRIHNHEQAMNWDGLPALTEEPVTEQLERAERMTAIRSEVARMKKAEQTVFTCLYQLDWSVAQTARGMGAANLMCTACSAC